MAAEILFVALRKKIAANSPALQTEAQASVWREAGQAPTI